MNKYLLPIYHSKLKPWIKWWLYKHSGKIPVPVLSDWIEGTTPITITGAFKEKIQNLELEGNTSQTGTPTPDNPIPVQVVKGHNVIKVNTTEYALDLNSKNKFNYQYSDLRNINRVTTSEETNGFKLTSNGASGYGFASLPIDNTLLGKTITISCTSTGNKTPSARLFYHNSSGTLTSNIGAFWTTNSSHTVTLPSELITNTTGIDIVFYISQANNTEGDYATFTNIMLNEGETALPYEEYYNYELCKIGDDYSDYILPDTNGYKIIKNVGKVVLKGTESWTRTPTASNYVFWALYTTLDIPVGRYEANSKLCDYFPYEFKNWTISSVNHLAENSANSLSLLFNVDTSIASTVEQWNSWLSTHNTTVYYTLATATTETITAPNLITQLNAIYNAEFKNGTNTITQTNSDLPFILHFKYYKKG